MPDMLDVLYRDVEKARRRIDIECYIFSSDKHGSGFAEKLCAAKERGVATRVLYDPLGSQKAEKKFFEDMCTRGVDFRPYRPAWVALGSGNLAPRDHGRIFLTDDVAYTGGAAWADQWAPKDAGGGGWYDINLRVAGPVVDDFAALFEQRWGEADGHGHTPKDFDTGSKYPELRLVGDTPRRDRSLVYDLHVDAIRAARRRIWMANAYFLPPPPMLRALLEAAARGVDVRIIVPAVSDLPIIRRAARNEYAHWIDGGMKVYEYQDVTMHSKYAVIDDHWCTVGTFNANSTSLGAANEINVFILRRDFVARCAEQLEEDLSSSKQIAAEQARDRSFLDQFLDQAADDVFALADVVVGPSDPPR
jgi:cardiolipin synthase A/B